MAADRNSNGADSVVRLIDDLLARAVTRNASDVHFEPLEQVMAVRFQLDGVLQEVDRLPAALAGNVIGRLKVLAGLLTYRIDIPQEGSFRFKPAAGPAGGNRACCDLADAAASSGADCPDGGGRIVELTVGHERVRYTGSATGLCREVLRGDGRADARNWVLPNTVLTFRLERFGGRPAVLWVLVQRTGRTGRTQSVDRLATAAALGVGGAL